MAYTINRGYSDNHGLDRLQRGLLVGLPALALILSFGAIRHHNPASSPTGENAKLIPIVSSLSNDTKKSSSNDGNASSNGGSSTAIDQAATGGSVQAASTIAGSSYNSTGGSTTSPPGTGPTLVGGMGGGPTTGGTGTSGGGATIPDCSLNQIATVTCQVPACSPTVTLAPGQKAILGVNGTCIIVN